MRRSGHLPFHRWAARLSLRDERRVRLTPERRGINRKSLSGHHRWKWNAFHAGLPLLRSHVVYGLRRSACAVALRQQTLKILLSGRSFDPPHFVATDEQDVARHTGHAESTHEIVFLIDINMPHRPARLFDPLQQRRHRAAWATPASLKVKQHHVAWLQRFGRAVGTSCFHTCQHSQCQHHQDCKQTTTAEHGKKDHL